MDDVKLCEEYKNMINATENEIGVAYCITCKESAPIECASNAISIDILGP